MNALSLKQPGAWLILHAGKDIEHRSWHTRCRGTVLIHASKRADPPQQDGCDFGVPFDAPRGAIVGTVDIVDCVNQSQSRWFNGP